MYYMVLKIFLVDTNAFIYLIKEHYYFKYLQNNYFLMTGK